MPTFPSLAPQDSCPLGGYRRNCPPSKKVVFLAAVWFRGCKRSPWEAKLAGDGEGWQAPVRASEAQGGAPTRLTARAGIHPDGFTGERITNGGKFLTRARNVTCTSEILPNYSWKEPEALERVWDCTELGREMGGYHQGVKTDKAQTWSVGSVGTSDEPGLEKKFMDGRNRT